MIDAKTRDELVEIAARYPEKRSGLLPMLHLVQSSEGRITPEGIELCAEILEISAADVSGVATFYTMYKRKPVGDYHVGVCTNTLCAVMGGDLIFERLKEHLDVGNDETSEHRPGDHATVTLEHLECNAACDYAPVMMVNWEFMDNQTPASATRLVDDLRAGAEVRSTRGPAICTWRQAARVLAGFPDDRADDGPGAGAPSLVGLGIARERGWTAPAGQHEGQQEGQQEGSAAGVPTEPGNAVSGAQESDDPVAEDAAVEAESPTETTAAEKGEAT